ncbi:sortase domain-bontaining protein [Nocardioides plantarum]|uniref:Sortase domain-bontaining protein n=1 Tax=Nocardioides plantarum TaxID=29299 RepID=A0ABV5K9Z8_9ACTN|nr:sortase [Nocardioides plantarum]
MTDPRSDQTSVQPAVPVPGYAPPPVPAPMPPPQRAPRAPRPPRPAPQGAGAVLGTAGTMVMLVSLWAVLQLLLLGGLSHDRQQTLLYDQFRVQLAETTAPLGPTVEVGDPVAIVTIPAIGVEEVVVEGTASGDTLAGPGHQRATPLPGQRGTSVLMGRAATYGGPFGDIGDLRPGDDIEVLTAQGRKTLDVLGVRREGDPIPVFTDPAVLTLVSAEGHGLLSALTPDTTVYVDAVAAEAFATPSGYGGKVPASEKPMKSDDTALPLLALWLALLVGLSVAIVLARQRWTATLVWIVAGPVAITLAWQTTDTAMRLLPNLL